MSLYPTRLTDNANAFDATVTGVSIGTDTNASGENPATIQLDVHEVFSGPERTSVTMRTWDFALPADPMSVVGLRVLLAAGPTLDLKFCGYSRPYSNDDAVRWRTVF